MRHYKKTTLLLIFFSFNTSLANELTCGDDCSWSYDEATHTLTITGSGPMKDYGPNGSSNGQAALYHAERPWNNFSSDIEHIVVSGLTSIGNRAFDNDMVNVKTIDISDSVTLIGSYAFDSMKSLTNLEIPDSVTTIRQGAFSSVTGLTNLFIPASVVSIETPSALSLFVNTTATVYCPEHIVCTGMGSKNIVSYSIDKSGALKVGDDYYASSQDLENGIKCVGGLTGECIASALNNKISKLVSQGKVCTTEDECQTLVYADYNGDILKVGNKSYASLDDLAQGKYIPKRIYTIDEANRVAGEKNRVSISYR